MKQSISIVDRIAPRVDMLGKKRVSNLHNNLCCCDCLHIHIYENHNVRVKGQSKTYKAKNPNFFVLSVFNIIQNLFVE